MRDALMKAAAITLLMMLTIASVTAATPLTAESVAPGGLILISSNTYSSAGTKQIYPGSKDVTMVVEVQNNEAFNISYVQACFTFPRGIAPASGYGSCVDATDLNGVYRTHYAPGQIFKFTEVVNVNKSVTPGTYAVMLKVYYTIDEPNQSVRTFKTLTTWITVSRYPPVRLKIVDEWWGSGEVFPGTSGATLYVRLKNVGTTNVDGGRAVLTVPEPLTPRKVRVSIPALSKGSAVTLAFNGIDVPVTVKPGVLNASLNLSLTAVTQDGVTYSYTILENIPLNISKPPKPLIKLINAVWAPTYMSSRGVTIYVTLQNLGQTTLQEVIANLTLPPGVLTRGHRSYAIATHTTPVSFGSVFTLVFRNLNVSLKSLRARDLTLNLSIVGSYRGAQYVTWFKLRFKLKPISENILYVMQEGWVWGGRPGNALPTSKHVTYEVRLVNLGQNPISIVVPKARLPKGFTLLSYGGTCLAGVAPGSSCTVDLMVDVSGNVSPGSYDGALNLTYVVSAGGAYLYAGKHINITLSVKPPSAYEPRLLLSRVGWGVTTPSVAYGRERRAAATITVVNLGRYVASNVYVTVTTPNASIKVLDGSGLCAATLPSGSACRLNPYLDLGYATKGHVLLRINVTYFITDYGAYVRRVKIFKASLKISTYAAQHLGNLQLVSNDWSGGLEVYPNTSGATYTVVLANHYPFSITAVTAYLKGLPPGIKPHHGMRIAYVAGPVPSNQIITLNFPLDISADVKPGSYSATLLVKYVVESGGSEFFKTSNYSVVLRVSRVTRGIEVITAGWAGSPAQPGTYGNYLYVVLRDDDFSVVKGLTARVTLPKGFTSTVNNESTVNVVATSSPQLSSLAARGVGGLRQVLSNPARAAQELSTLAPAGQLSKGDFAFLVIGVNVLNVTPGTYWGNATLVFFDQWGDMRTWRVRFPIEVLGTALYIRVWTNTVLNFNRSRAEPITINILNEGSAPIYDTYLTIYSPTSYLLVKSTPIYLGTLQPGRVRRVNVTVFFNPISLSQAPVTITYGNMPFIVTLLYSDVMGVRHVYNASVTVSVSPFIKLLVQGVKVTQEGRIVTLSATLTNLGNAQAQRVVAYLRVNGRVSQPSFIGDVDPSSQTSFEVSANASGRVSKVYLILKYRNPFNEPREVVLPYRVSEYVPPPATTTTAAKGVFASVGPYKVGVVIAVIAFLAAVVIAIKRYLRRHEVAEVPI